MHVEELTSESDVSHSSGSSGIDVDSSSEMESDEGTINGAPDAAGALTPREQFPSVGTSAALPRLSLPVPRLDIAATPLQGDDTNIAPPSKLSAVQQAGGAVVADTRPMAMELLSPAFALSYSNGKQLDELQHQCSLNLGVRQDRVRLYSLVELSSIAEAPAGCQRLAVEVKGSAFSLHAMESILQENQRLTAAASIVSQPTSRGAVLDASNQSEIECLKKEIVHLRQRLTSSELLRHRGQQALQELKEEFETLHFDLMHSGDGTDTVHSTQTVTAIQE